MSKNLAVFLVFVILTGLTTYPLIFKFDSAIPGFFSTDEPFGTIWNYWRAAYSWKHNISLRYTTLISHPFGLDVFRSDYIPYLYTGIAYFLSIVTGPVFAYNMQMVLNIFLSGIFTYLLVFYLIKNREVAFFSGLIFSFCPYQFSRIWQHPGLTYNQWLPLALFSAILLRERASRTAAILFGISLFLLYSFDLHIAFFGSVIILLFLVYSLVYNLKKGLLKQDLIYYKKAVILWILVLAVLCFQFFPFIKNILKLSSATTASVFNPYHRPFEYLFTQSARPLSYFLPSIVHPVFGKFTERFIGSPLYGDSFTEHTLYLGWTPLVLAFVAFKNWRRKRKPGTMIYELPARDDFYIGFFILMAIAAWFLSQPPWWKVGPLRVFMPSFFIYRLLPMFRAYCRFGIVLMLAVAVLAGFGLNFILRRFKTKKARVAIACLFCGLVLFEFWNYPPFRVIDVSKVPEVYYWLKAQSGDFVIAEYPLDADSPNEMYKFYQTEHQKKIINGTIPGLYANRAAKTIVKLSEPNTAGVLKRMGVRYVLVHRDGYLNTELMQDREELGEIPDNAGLKFIRSFPSQECPEKDIICVQTTGPIDVYEIVAQPKEPK